LADCKKFSKRLKIINSQPRAGKPSAINTGVSEAFGDVLILGDANVIIEPEALLELLLPFADPNVGSVCAKVAVRGMGNKEIAGESLYMKFESRIQEAEAKFWTMVGTDGALFALRRNLFTPLADDTILDDFALSMQAPLAGQRIVYASDARAVEEVQSSVVDEFRRKSRIVAGGYQYLYWLLRNKCRLGWRTWFSFVSHKLMRWLSPFFLFGLFLCSLALKNDPLFKLILTGQLALYFLALTAHIIPAMRKYHTLYIPYYFFVINLAALMGLLRSIAQKQNVLWDKVSR
jgi:cellulose synthase/poly-beta-1,6-N-acetylglucosamine synthase-like glycosyltransferase